MNLIFILTFFFLLSGSLNGYQFEQIKIGPEYSEQKLLAALCWSLPFKFIKCDIEFEEKILKQLRIEQIPRHKVSTTDEIVYNVRIQSSSNGFLTSAVLAVRAKYGVITSNDSGNPITPIPHQLKQASTALFGLPHQAKNVSSSVNCVLIYSQIGDGFYYIQPGKNEHKSIPRNIPENIYIKVMNEKSKTREMFYMTLLANQQFPIKPTATYGVGVDFLIPPMVCFSTSEELNQQYHENKSYLGGILMYERVIGPSLRDVIKFFKSSAMLKWLNSSNTNEFDYKSRVALRLEAQYSLAHSVIAAILTLQHHSIAGRLLHCDLNTRSIHIDRLIWSWSSKKVEENLNSLTQLSPSNIKFTNFGYMRSTLEVEEENLRCIHTENDLLRVQQLIKSIFSEQSNKRDFPESGSFSSGMLTISTGIKMKWNDFINTIGSEVSDEKVKSKELLEVEYVLRIVNSEPSVIDNLEKSSTFVGIVSGIKAIHAALSKVFRRLCDQGYTKGRKRIILGWSSKDIEPEPPNQVSSTVKKILSGKKVENVRESVKKGDLCDHSQTLELSAETSELS